MAPFFVSAICVPVEYVAVDYVHFDAARLIVPSVQLF